MNKNAIKIAALVAAAMAAVAPAHADLVNNNSVFSVVEDFESFDVLLTSGPTALDGGVQLTSSIISTLGANNVDLGVNGVWGAGNNFAGIGDLSFLPSSYDYDGSMTFSWSQGRTGAGALFSIYQEESGSAEILLEALDAYGAVLESSSVLINFADSGLYNAATFYGFLRGSADVYGLRVTGDGFVLDNVSFAPVPLPAGLPLLISGLAMLGAAVRRKRA